MVCNSLPLIDRIKPAMVIEYLRHTGWDCRAKLRSGAYLYECNHNQVIIPFNKSYDDFKDTLTECIHKLSSFVETPASTICEKILFLNTETLDFRVISNKTENGTLPFPDWIKHGNSIRDTLLSAKRQTLEPSPFHLKIATKRTEAWLNSCLMGQTQIGSYINKVFIPLTDEDESAPQSQQPKQLPLDDSLVAEPAGREVISLIINTANKVAAATTSKGMDQLLEENTKKNFLNANLCHAISELIDSESGDSIEISTSPSSLCTRPLAQTKVYIPHSAKPTFNDVIEAIKPTTPPEKNVTLDAFVFGNEKYPKKDKGHGLIKCLTILNDEEIKFKAQLSEDDYYSAVKNAHAMGRTIRISGTLTQKGKSKVLENITSFKIL